VHLPERPLAAADGRAHRVYDYGISHELFLPVSDSCQTGLKSNREREAAGDG
jgi:hypothetical protein